MNTSANAKPAATHSGLRALRRLWIFEDHQCFCELLSDFLETIPGIEIVGKQDDEARLFEAIDAGQVDLVLLDLHLRGAGGFHVMERLRQRPNPPPVLILSGQATPHSLSRAMSLGAVGYLQKTAPLSEIVPALEAIRSGGSYFSEGALRQLSPRVAVGSTPSYVSEMNPREVDLLSRLAHGATAKELAADWELSRFTIYKLRTVLMRKIKVVNQRELMAYALRNGLLDPSLVR